MPVPQFVAHLAGVVIIGAFAESETRTQVRIRGNIRRRRRDRLRLRHFVTDRHRALDWARGAAAIGKKSERRLRAHFRLPHHVGKNFDRRAGAVLSAETEDTRPSRSPIRKKMRKKPRSIGYSS